MAISSDSALTLIVWTSPSPSAWVAKLAKSRSVRSFGRSPAQTSRRVPSSPSAEVGQSHPPTDQSRLRVFVTMAALRAATRRMPLASSSLTRTTVVLPWVEARRSEGSEEIADQVQVPTRLFVLVERRLGSKGQGDLAHRLAPRQQRRLKDGLGRPRHRADRRRHLQRSLRHQRRGRHPRRLCHLLRLPRQPDQETVHRMGRLADRGPHLLLALGI